MPQQVCWEPVVHTHTHLQDAININTKSVTEAALKLHVQQLLLDF